MKRIIVLALLVLAVGAGAWYFLRSSDVAGDMKNYVGYSVEECSRVQVMCVEGFERFDDETGCGCQELDE